MTYKPKKIKVNFPPFEKSWNVLLIYPRSPFLSFRALRNSLDIYALLEGEKFVFGIDEIYDFLDEQGFNYHLIKDPLKLPKNLKIDLVIDMSEPPTPYKYLPVLLNSKMSLSFDPKSYPYFRIVVQDNLTYQGIYTLFPRFSRVSFQIPEYFMRLAWQFLIYKGYQPSKYLIFLDKEINQNSMTKIMNFFEGNTFVSFGGSSNSIDISRRRFWEKLAILSMSNYYFGSNSFFLEPALENNLEVIILDMDLEKFLAGKRVKYWDGTSPLEEIITQNG